MFVLGCSTTNSLTYISQNETNVKSYDTIYTNIIQSKYQLSSSDHADFQEEFVIVKNLLDIVYFRNWNEYFEFISQFKAKRDILNSGHAGYSCLYEYLFDIGTAFRNDGQYPMMIRLALREKELLFLREQSLEPFSK